MSPPSHIFAATKGNFPELVLENSRRGLVVVDFWSPRAGPSRRQREVLSRLAQELKGRFLLVTVNTDEQPELARDYGVRSLPSCKLFHRGRIVEEIRGMQPEADYRKILERHLGGAAGGLQREAMACWQRGDRERAIRILAEGAMAAPDDAQLPLLMAKLLMQAGRHRDAHAVLTALPVVMRDEPEIVDLTAHLDLIVTAADAPEQSELDARLAAEPGDHASRYALASVLLVRDDYEGSMAQLMALQRHAPDFREGVARRALLALFRMLDPADERVKRFRTELFNLSH